MRDERSKDAGAGVSKKDRWTRGNRSGHDAHMYDVVKVGKEELMGEVIKIQGEKIIIQVYEDTSGITARGTGREHRPPPVR